MVRVRLPALQMKEHCAMVGTRFMRALETCCQQARGTISWREFKKVYDSLFEGPFTEAQGGRITVHDRRFTARSLSSKSGGPDACPQRCRKTWRYVQPNEGEETFLAGTCCGLA